MRDHIDTGHTDLHHTVLRFLSFPNAFSKDPFGSGFCLLQMPSRKVSRNLNALNVELPDMSSFGFERARKIKEEKANEKEKEKEKEQEDDLEKEKEKEDVKEQKDEKAGDGASDGELDECPDGTCPICMDFKNKTKSWKKK